MLEALARSDQYLEQLWTWLQSQPVYRDTTHILITTDHGRGHTPGKLEEPREDGGDAGETWMAFVSPSMSARAEWSGEPPIKWMDGDWTRFDPAAAPPVR